jgi:hypothetical protein
MLAGGMVIAAPSMVPEAAAAGALYVSAENAMFNNLFAGAMVLEIIVVDPARADTDESEGEPTVLVDNMPLRLAQALDGNWYGYIADKTAMDGLHDITTDQLFSGTESAAFEAATSHAHRTHSSSMLYIDIADDSGLVDNAPSLSNWNATSNAVTVGAGQTDLGVDWPFIQAFDFTQGDFDIVLEQAGADEVVRIDHNNEDLDDYASLTLDRNAATQGAELYLLINDQQLNIDPTDEDVIIFDVKTDGTSASNGVTWTNGTIPTNWAGGTNSFSTVPAKVLMDRDVHGFGDNGLLLININTTGAAQNVLVKDTTEDDALTATTAGFFHLVFYEDADNTGTFSNVDNDDNSNLDVSTTAIRGTTATIDYNDTAQSFTVANDFGVIDMDQASVGDEWNSGEVLAITLTDQDLNLNTWLDEDLTLANPSGQQAGSDLIPSMQIGSPLVLKAPPTGMSTIEISNWGSNATIQAFSKIGIVTATASDNNHAASLAIQPGSTISELRSAMSSADYSYINYDVTSLVSADVTAVGLSDQSSATAGMDSVTPSGDGKRGMALIENLVTDANGFEDDEVFTVNFTTTADITANDRFYVDIFTFGDGTTLADRVNNAIYRFELEETDDNTATFVGEVEYVMLNQLNVDEEATFSGITPTSDEVVIIVHEDLTDEDSPRINYNDLGADGVITQVADQTAAPSHSGVVSFDSDNYKKADTVVVTLEDQDLNVDSDLIDVYITKSDAKVGNLGTDHLLDITFNDEQWLELDDQSFTLVETGTDSGIFVGSFQVPSTYVNSSAETVTTTGTDIEVN